MLKITYLIIQKKKWKTAIQMIRNSKNFENQVNKEMKKERQHLKKILYTNSNRSLRSRQMYGSRTKCQKILTENLKKQEMTPL